MDKLQPVHRLQLQAPAKISQLTCSARTSALSQSLSYFFKTGHEFLMVVIWSSMQIHLLTQHHLISYPQGVT